MTILGKSRSKSYISWVLVLAFGLSIATSRTCRADGPTPIDPSNPYLILLKWLTQFDDLDQASMALLVSMGVTLKSYFAFNNALGEARSLRRAAINRLRILEVDQAEFSRKMAPVNKAFSEWDLMESQARQALVDLTLKVKQFDTIPKSQRKSWLKSNKGLAWMAETLDLNRVITRDLDAAYDSVIRTSRIAFPETQKSVATDYSREETDPRQRIQSITSSDRLQNRMNRLDTMADQLDSIKGRCRNTLLKFDTDIKAARAATRWRNHIGARPWIWGTGTVVGTAGSVITYRSFRQFYGKDPVELSADAARRNQTKLQAEIDLCGQVSSPEGREQLKKTFLAITTTLKTLRPRIIQDLGERLSEFDKSQLSARGYSPEDLIGFLSEPEHLQFGIERAFCQAGKKQIGERASIAQLLNYLYPKDKAIRDIERPAFVHDFWVAFFNTIWSQLQRGGGGANRITDPVMIDLETQLLRALDNNKEVAPIAPPTPGIGSKTDPKNFNLFPEKKISALSFGQNLSESLAPIENALPVSSLAAAVPIPTGPRKDVNSLDSLDME